MSLMNLKMGRRLVVALLAVLSLAPAAALAQGKPHMMIETKDGIIDIELLPEIAPKHVERVITLAQQGFYDGVVFHRVIADFMAQTGDPTGTGRGGSELPDVEAEFSGERYVRGTVGAARGQDPNTFNSQFFITFGDASFLEGGYTVFGRVVAGMDVVDRIKKGDPQSGAMENPDKMLSVEIENR